MTLIDAHLWLPPLPLAVDSDADPEWLLVRVTLRQPPRGGSASDLLLAATIDRSDATVQQHLTQVEAAVLAGAARDHLVAELASATVLSRTAGDDSGSRSTPPPAEHSAKRRETR